MATAVIHVTEDKPKDNLDEMTPVCGCCILTYFLNMNVPACFGMGAQGDLLCMNLEMEWCRVVTKDANQHLAKDDATCCVFIHGDWTCMAMPKTCISQHWSMCCLSCRAAMPPNKEAPCMINVAGLTICYDFKMKCKCLKTIGEIAAPSGGAPGTTVDDEIEEAPEAAEMERATEEPLSDDTEK